MSDARVALVIGANQGLGCALAAGLAARLDPDDLVLLTGRDARRVTDAAAAVTTRPETRGQVIGRALDVGDPSAVAGMAAELADRHGGVDIVVSNAIAALTPDRPQSEQAYQFINVANRLRPLFDEATLEQVEAAVESWRTAIHDGTAEEQGWPGWINVPSKVAQVAAVRAVAAQRRAADLATGTLLAAVCPGLVDTRASRPWFDDYSRAQTPEQAAQAVLDLILADRPDPASLRRTRPIRPGPALAQRNAVPQPGPDAQQIEPGQVHPRHDRRASCISPPTSPTAPAQ